MKPLTIGIIVCVIIAICAAVYFLTKPKTNDKTKEQTLLDNVPMAFGLGENFSNETFDTTIVFNNFYDIKNNMMALLNYLYPKMNINEINTLLNHYSSGKNMDTILLENKGKISPNSTIFLYIQYYIPFLFISKDEKGNIDKNIDNETIKTNIRLFISVSNLIQNIYFISTYTFPYTYDENTITKMKIILSPDYKTNDIISLYMKTNINENIALDNASKNDGFFSNECLYNKEKLCKHSININEEVIDKYKEKSRNNFENFEKIFNLIVTRFLLELSDSDVSEINSNIDNIYTSSIKDQVDFQNPNSKPYTGSDTDINKKS